MLAYVTKIEIDLTEVTFKPPRDIAKRLFGLGPAAPLRIARPESYIDKYRIPTDTSGGAIAYAAYDQFIPKKIGVMHGHIHEFLFILENTFRRALGSDEVPLLPWRCATRGKLLHIKDAEEKMAAGKSLSRMVSFCEPLERFLVYPIYSPIMKQLLQSRINKNLVACQVGIRKNSRDWKDLREALAEYNYVMTSDWSNFDASVPAELLRYAWRVIASAFSAQSREERF